MARIGNETKLILKLAAERKVKSTQAEPHAFRDDQRHEAYTMGLVEGQRIYEANLQLIVIELEEAR